MNCTLASSAMRNSISSAREISPKFSMTMETFECFPTAMRVRAKREPPRPFRTMRTMPEELAGISIKSTFSTLVLACNATASVVSSLGRTRGSIAGKDLCSPIASPDISKPSVPVFAALPSCNPPKRFRGVNRHASSLPVGVVIVLINRQRLPFGVLSSD